MRTTKLRDTNPYRRAIGTVTDMGVAEGQPLAAMIAYDGVARIEPVMPVEVIPL